MTGQRKKMLESLFRLSRKLFEAMKQPNKFGTDKLLYSSEIHTLEMIGKYPGITVTELADRQGISKSALPKLIHKLIQKDMLYRYQEPGNKKNILLELTNKGRLAVHHHFEFHETFDSGIMKKINSLTPEEYFFLSDLLEELEQYIDHMEQEK
ncbi:MarR family winged helix-turn-helix transcriptional regulator [Pectinatus cerevisiiphilus]|uniref:MarR family transcriptional regulator n=1 Tax=Pectinatus cerevisiiphilus TaxID=86956 RepID=A0A4R3K1D9_9FIRM|nr:MarR family transcriptional regulator [Pectinatus cerevisiiphilus]TCS75246.1 MarR family transcriptional regulator [Pectinatus cerevisiiphilus]